MPPVEPMEEKIEVAMTARLDTIRAAAGYWTSPTVTRELLPIDQYSPADLQSGVVGVMRASGSDAEVNPRDASLDHSYRVAVWGYVATGAAIAATMLNRLTADVRRCLMTDRLLGGLVLDLRPDGPRDTDDGARGPTKAFFRQHWVVRATEDF